MDLLVHNILNGDIRATSILPLIEANIPLLPFPVLLKLILAKKTSTGDIAKTKSLKYITPKALNKTVKLLREDVHVDIDENYLRFTTSSGMEEQLYCKTGILAILDEKQLIDKVTTMFYTVDYIRNRIDRISGAADLYHMACTMPLQKMYFILYIGNKDLVKIVHSSIKLLAETGIGGKHSIGLGKFRIVETENVEEFNPILYKYLPSTPDDESYYWVSMGKYVPENNRELVEKYYEADIVAGIGGGIIPYRLPATKVMLLGSTISTSSRKIPKGLIDRLDSIIPSIILFNPIFYKLPLTRGVV